ncbi:MAG: MobA protein [Rikenellaceae bacterium]|jgi:hypothetical protein|nr:MobA protein [Rikenellaceae bacterium]
MEEENVKKKRSRAGRKPKINPASHRYTVNLNDEDNARFLLMMAGAKMENISRFLHHAIFGREIRVVKIDKAASDYYIRLTNFYRQFQAIGNNYNQTVKAIKVNFGEKRALQLLVKLEKATIELIVLSRKIIELTKEFAEKYGPDGR